MDFVVATDGSTHSEAAIEHAAALAGATGGSLTIVHAVDPAVRAEGGGDPGDVADVADAADRLLVEAPDDAEERGQRILDNAADAVGAEVPVETVLLEGDPVGAIVGFAAEGFDGVVVGHRGLSERYEQQVGSVAKSLVARSPVPVTVVSPAGDGGRPGRTAGDADGGD